MGEKKGLQQIGSICNNKKNTFLYYEPLQKNCEYSIKAPGILITIQSQACKTQSILMRFQFDWHKAVHNLERERKRWSLQTIKTQVNGWFNYGK